MKQHITVEQVDTLSHAVQQPCGYYNCNKRGVHDVTPRHWQGRLWACERHRESLLLEYADNVEDW